MPTATITSRARIRQNTDPGRRARFWYGMEPSGLFVPALQGYSEFPNIDNRAMTAKFHFYDELEKISRYKLSGGSLQQSIRTDRYIWGILDEVYQDYFTVIASCDLAETWSDGVYGTITDDTTDHRGGTAARKIAVVDNGPCTTSKVISPIVDIAEYGETKSFIAFFLYVDDATKLDTLKIRFYTDGSNYYQYDMSASGSNAPASGWNQIYIPLYMVDNYGVLGTTEIVKVEVEAIALYTHTCTVIFDEIRVVKYMDYPFRYFDIGLQTIPIAWWAGNTALYEIKTACESEQARFYSDEYGNLYFENRQHYNLNDGKKVSVWGFDYNNLIDLAYSSTDNEIINKVIVKLKPRKIRQKVEIVEIVEIMRKLLK